MFWLLETAAGASLFYVRCLSARFRPSLPMGTSASILVNNRLTQYHELLARQLRYYRTDSTISMLTGSRCRGNCRWVVTYTSSHFGPRFSFPIDVSRRSVVSRILVGYVVFVGINRRTSWEVYRWIVPWFPLAQARAWP